MQKRQAPQVFSKVETPEGCPYLLTRNDEVSPETIASLHFHALFEIGLCHEGSGIFVLDGNVHSYNAGDITMAAPNVPHFAQSSTEVRSFWTWLMIDMVKLAQAGFAPEIVGALRSVGGATRLQGKEVDKLRALLEWFIEESASRSRLSVRSADGLLQSIIAVVARMTKAGRGEQSPPRGEGQWERILPALTLMSDLLADDVSVEACARACSISVRAFTDAFVRLLGRTPHTYLIETRLAMACALLREGSMGIAQIAYRCGFSTLSTFNRQFARAHGCSPREWRRRA